jgi:two-component system chemotaxis response regulator CheB
MSTRDIIVVGASAGGVEAMSRLVAGLPADFPAAVFVTLHFPSGGISVLPRILSRAGKLPAVHPEDGDAIEYGRIYVAPPDRHLLINRTGIRLVRGPTENGNRPAIDPMFRSAAVSFGPQVIGVVLTGNLDDGTAGLLAIKRAGGIAVVQDPDDAMFSSMPSSALQHVAADHVTSLDDLSELLSRLVEEPIPDIPKRQVKTDVRENAYSAFDLAMIENPQEHPGQPSSFGCPDCGGVLWQLQDGEMTRFRCRVGHGWTSDALIERQQSNLDAALWTALRALEENVALANQMASRFEKRGAVRIAKKYRDDARLTLERADVIRNVIMIGQPPLDREAPESVLVNASSD